MKKYYCYTFRMKDESLVLLTKQFLGLRYEPMIFAARRNKEGKYVYMALNPLTRYQYKIKASQFSSWLDYTEEHVSTEDFSSMLDKMGCNGKLCLRTVNYLLKEMADMGMDKLEETTKWEEF